MIDMHFDCMSVIVNYSAYIHTVFLPDIGVNEVMTGSG